MDKIATFITFILKMIEYYFELVKKKTYIEQGQKEVQLDISKKEADVTRTQAEILIQDKTKEQVVDRMKDGSF